MSSARTVGARASRAMAMKMVGFKRLRLSHTDRDLAILNANHSHYHRATLRMNLGLRIPCLLVAATMVGRGGAASQAAVRAAPYFRNAAFDNLRRSISACGALSEPGL